MFKIYHNPRCRKSREGLAYLQGKTAEIELVEYLRTGLTKEMLEEIMLKSGIEPQNMVRKQEELFKKELKGKNFTREEWLQILIENPKLLQRPFIVSKHKAVLAQPPKTIDRLF